MSTVVVLVTFLAGIIVGVTLALVLRRAAKQDDPAPRINELLEPLRHELERYDQRLTSFDRERAMQFGALSEQLHIVSAASEGLKDQTQQLAAALRNPTSRGRWGEIQLKRVVELAGMAEHCDFTTQVTTSGETEDGERRQFRPDMVVRLPGGRTVIVDSKAPLSAYLDASNATNDRDRRLHLKSHAGAVRSHA